MSIDSDYELKVLRGKFDKWKKAREHERAALKDFQDHISSLKARIKKYGAKGDKEETLEVFSEISEEMGEMT